MYIGETLKVKPGAWKPSGVKLSYQWYRGSSKIKGATKSSYKLTSKDKGNSIRVKVTGKKSGYKSVTKTSKAASKVKVPKKLSSTPMPKITGTAKVGKTLKVKAGSWKPSGVKLSYQWYRGSSKIKGATKSSYKLTSKDKGKTIKVKVTGKKTGYKTVARTSKATATVEAGSVSVKVSTIKDPNLRACIVDEAGLFHTDTLTWSTAKAVTNLDCSWREIETLEGMPVLPNLTSLQLEGNSIQTATVLPDLPRLAYLGLKFNPLSSVERLPRSSAVPELEVLNVQGTGLETLKGLPAYRGLATLGARENGLTDLKGMPSLPRLEELLLRYNDITTLEGMPRLPKLANLELVENPLRDRAADTKRLQGLVPASCGVWWDWGDMGTVGA
ncbi:hypothetical protein [Tessaracoccus caeni]|uniref:hypothetical protein n=1 Tax=Tessaracoccus caeni TaxID=3031239 RepID=UPI0023DC3DD9|nr:hypothetical protein [Tessaracoccus caeni]MDF1487705.1 hypothetical protein [Tessaracoccus caeni]